MMEWPKLLDEGRLEDPDYAEQPNRPIYVQDLDRVVFSAPFRRLANKTQVHPLYENDHLHHRLIHSVETGSIGRSLGIMVGQWLEDTKVLTSDDKHKISGMVQAACLAHDIGNPPFGHSGEAAIGEWFKTRLAARTPLLVEVSDEQRAEFEAFEGNAQGFRILTRLEMFRDAGGMRLSHGVLAAFAKYPTTAWVRSGEESITYNGLKKFGVFESDLETFKAVTSKVGLPEVTNAHGSWWKRHPLVFLVEAADDICYGILDIEDAMVAGDISFEEAKSVVVAVAGAPNADISDRLETEQIAALRAHAIGFAIAACVDAFKANYDAIMDGTFSSSLIEVSSVAGQFKKISDLAKERVFTGPRKTELEVAGRNAIHTVMDGLAPTLETLGREGWDASKLDGYDKRLVRAVGFDLRGATDPYSALHALTDFVSGMTDRYTLRVAKMLSHG